MLNSRLLLILKKLVAPWFSFIIFFSIELLGFFGGQDPGFSDDMVVKLQRDAIMGEFDALISNVLVVGQGLNIFHLVGMV